MKRPVEHGMALPLYFTITYLILLFLNYGMMDFAVASSMGWKAALFTINAFASYNAMYLAPAMLLTWLAGRSLVWRWLRLRDYSHAAKLVVAVVGGGLTTLFFYANAKLFTLYGMFVNGFVINLIKTPGGLESLGGSDASNIGFVLLGLGFLVGHAGLMWLVRATLEKGLSAIWPTYRLAPVMAVIFVVSTLGDRAAYAYNNAIGDSDMLAVTQGIPFYVSTTAKTFFRKLGYKVVPQEKFVGSRGKMQYPANSLHFIRPEKPYNIVWLASESWRADTLNAEIMPNTWDFAQKAQNFKLHYSGGNGTRAGIFTMMTGVPGIYWHPFMETHQGAPIIEVLQQQNYQMSLYTSAKFSYPEFDQTIFSKVPKNQLHELEHGDGWERDRKNVTDLLQFIEQRDPGKPFFTFMFFESPHARYNFPPESVIRRPYRDDINYATLSREELRDNIEPIKNRYLNAVHHLDSQFARVLTYLESHGLMHSTIIVMVGDHGEEFMEDGYWGHNSTFSDPQTRTPLVLWIPGIPATSHDKITSHLDIPATLMPLLGVSNPVQDYAVGINLLSSERHQHVLLSDWSHVGYLDNSVKITFPLNVQGGVGKKITGPHDEKLSAPQAQMFFQAAQPHLVQLMDELGRFNRHAGSRKSL